MATLTAGLVGVCLSALLDPSALDAWGWRAAMLLGALILPFGLVLRMSLPETLDIASALPAPQEPVTGRLRLILCGLGALGSATIATYVMNYMTTYASQTLHMKAGLAFSATVMVGGCTAVFSVLGGALSDRFGRRALMIWPRLAMLAAILPAFMWVIARRDQTALLGATALLAVSSALSATPILVCLAEALPSRSRSGAVGVIYAVAIAVFGGTTQLVITWLIHVSGQEIAPAWYLAGATAVGLVAVAMLPETAPRLKRV